MTTSLSATARVRRHFQQKATSFDALYEVERLPQRILRPGLLRRREFAVGVVRSYGSPAVLDVGCGSGRVGEHLLAAGAQRYVGIDFSAAMLDLARERLTSFGSRVELLQGDFLEAPLEGPFDVVVALGLFDYTPEPHRFSRRMAELCTGSVAASFPRWTWIKGPIRKLRYELANDCPIFNYTERELGLLFGASGFSRVDVLRPGRGGFLVRADR